MTPEIDKKDSDLLREFVEHQSEAAFAGLVARYVNLVYSVAMRQAGDSHQAEEITQAVFIILSKKAGTLRHEQALSSWLFQTTRLTTKNFLRSELRRRRREQEAYMQSMLNEPADPAWPQIAPLLDSALETLGETDRRAILLRFYEGRKLGEVGAVLGATEDAAKKRVNRALEKLRKYFSRRGVTLTAGVIAAAVTANSVQAAPTGLAKAATVMGIVKGASATATTLALAKTVIEGTAKLTWLKITTASVVLANVIISQQMVATHFNFAGRPDAWMTRSQFLVWSVLAEIGFPLFFLAVGYGIRFLPVNRYTFKNIPNREYWLAPERRDEMFRCVFHNFLWMACFGALFMLAIQLLVVYANHQTPPQLPTWAILVVSGCFIAAVWSRIYLMIRYLKQV